MLPSRRCCSTEAGSVSPCVTISRRRLDRCSPGTCCHTGFAHRIAKTDAPIGHRVGEKDPPPVFRHGDVAIARPTVFVGCRGGAQIHVAPKRARSHFPPPVEKSRLPLFESTLQRAVVGEADIVRDPLVIVDRHCFPLGYARSQSNRARAPLP